MGECVLTKPRVLRYKDLDRDFKVNDHGFWDRVEDGAWETAAIEKLLGIVKDTDIIFDVGAWIGVYTLLLSHLAKSVVAFEPCPFSRQILIENLALNDIHNVAVESHALSDQESEEKIYYYNPTKLDNMLASSMLNMVDRGESRSGLSIATTTIDAYCERNQIRPDGIKIDVEGYEAKVLRGCKVNCWKLVELHGSFAESPQVEGELVDGDWDRGHLFVEAA